MSTNFQNITINSSVNPVDLAYPDNIGNIVNDSIVYSRSNTSLFDALQQKPDYITFHFDAYSNPSHNTSIENIVVDTSSLKIKAEFYLPIWFKSDGFGTKDTMDFDMEKTAGKSLDSIEYMLFRVVSENGMPVSMNLQIYFAELNHDTLNILDSLYKTKEAEILVGGVIGSDGKVISPTPNIQDAVFNSDQLKAIKHTKKLLIKLSLKTSNNPYDPDGCVKFYSSYQFKLSLAFKFQAKFRGYF
jgi:hypothetical protein